MKASLRVTCSQCGPLATAVITATPEVIARTVVEMGGIYYGHDCRNCGGEVHVDRKDHKPRARKAVSS